jgi:hypothetical protein
MRWDIIQEFNAYGIELVLHAFDSLTQKLKDLWFYWQDGDEYCYVRSLNACRVVYSSCVLDIIAFLTSGRVRMKKHGSKTLQTAGTMPAMQVWKMPISPNFQTSKLSAIEYAASKESGKLWNEIEAIDKRLFLHRPCRHRSTRILET